MTTLEQMGAKAKDASRFLMTAGSKKDIALGAIADALCENCEEILAANKIDLENGEKKRSYSVTSRQAQIVRGENQRYG